MAVYRNQACLGMSSAILFSIGLIFLAPCAHGAPRVETSCERDEDCVLIEGVCPGSWVGVNKAYEQQERERIAKLMPYVECLRVSDSETSPPMLVCADQTCTVQKSAQNPPELLSPK